MRRIVSLTAALAFVAISLLPLSPIAQAATAPAQNPANIGQALEIAPPVINVAANPGQTINTQIFIRDISSGPLLVTGQVNDFVAAGEDGTPKVLLDNSDTNNPYSMKDWVAPLPQLTLIPHEIKTLSVTIKVPADASPGGHYGVVRFTARPPSLDTSGVSLSASLGSLILLTVNGQTTRNLTKKDFSVNKDGKTGSLFQSAPLNFVEILSNKGNVHEQPTGQVRITDMFGRQLATLNVNQPPGNILPNSSRKFTQPLDHTVIGNKRLFGRYKAVMSVKYGNNQTLTSALTFWVIPYKTIAVVVVALIGLFFILRFAIKRYNRFIRGQGQKRH